ncbi:MAG: glycosyltransferase family 4 protein [Betaproteobacteria bacterium]|nr:glycosyltransferase family 4 protein [Betaproteobacteria bacterium]
MKILLFANTDWYLFNFRLPLAKALRERGHEVILLSPPGDYATRLEQAGFRWLAFPFSRQGVNPWGELVTLTRLIRLYRREKIDIAHHFTIKCVLYGAIAARLSGVKLTISAVTGLGHVFTTPSARNRLLRPLVSLLYRFALVRSQVIFQNRDDHDAFIRLGLTRADNSHLISSSGVNIHDFSPATPKPHSPPFRVLMVARLLKEKGVREYVEAAALVRRARPDVACLLAGSPDPGNPSSIEPSQIAQWDPDGHVTLLGHVDNIREWLPTCHLAVLPSYREGTPRSLVEAAACGLPLVATDVPGCREIVRHGDNGLLVPAYDAASLAAAILQLLADPDLCTRMGQRSRTIAVNAFSEARIIAETLKIYGHL